MRKTALLVTASGALLAALVALSGVAWALITIQCSDPLNIWNGMCVGTDGDERIIGTDKRDTISSEKGNDVVKAGRGPDYITTGDYDWHRGHDVNYGGPGNDRIDGHLDSERHYGGLGDDSIVDPKSVTAPDVFHCGSGYDRVYYNPGIDTIADDCEELHPVEW